MNKIPEGRCLKCDHYVYQDDNNHERIGFTDASGNNAREYKHTKCPEHIIEFKEMRIHYECKTCGAAIMKITRWNMVDRGEFNG